MHIKRELLFCLPLPILTPRPVLSSKTPFLLITRGAKQLKIRTPVITPGLSLCFRNLDSIFQYSNPCSSFFVYWGCYFSHLLWIGKEMSSQEGHLEPYDCLSPFCELISDCFLCSWWLRPPGCLFSLSSSFLPLFGYSPALGSSRSPDIVSMPHLSCVRSRRTGQGWSHWRLSNCPKRTTHRLVQTDKAWRRRENTATDYTGGEEKLPLLFFLLVPSHICRKDSKLWFALWSLCLFLPSPSQSFADVIGCSVVDERFQRITEQKQQWGKIHLIMEFVITSGGHKKWGIQRRRGRDFRFQIRQDSWKQIIRQRCNHKIKKLGLLNGNLFESRNT